MTGLLHDLRSAVRLFGRDWRFSATLVVTLATGIAATAIVFNVLNNTLLRPLPIPDEDRVYRLLDWTRGPDGQPLRRSTRVHNFLAIRDNARSFESIVALRALNFALDGGDLPVQVYVGLVSPRAFALLGVRPVLGRLFTPYEEEAGTDAGVILLSHALWQQQLGGRPDAIGSTLRLDGRPHTVVGILGPGFRFPYEVDAWVPERIAPHVEASVATIARLAPNVTPDQAAQELDAIAAAMEEQRPDTNRGMRYFMQPLREQLIGNQAQVTWSLFATAALLLGLSCANVANLLLARGTRRTREMAVQSAIGASRARQVQQLIVESLVYCAAGTVAGLILAALLGDSVMSLVPLPLRTQLGLGSVSFDWRVALFASAATAATAVTAGLVPAHRLAKTNPVESLRQQSRGSTGPRTLMQSLVVGEVALASVLLMASALMADNLARLNTADLGLRAAELSAIEITLPESRYAAAPDRTAVVRAIIDAARSVASVQQAAIVTVNPLDRGSFGAAIETEDRPLAPREPGHIVNNRLVTDGWFEAAGVTLRQGRYFTAQDNEHAPLVAIVSHRMANRFWPGDDAVGKRVRLARPGTSWLTVVGVVGDVRDFGDWRETWYLPYPQHASTLAASNLHLMLRSPLPPDVLGRAMQQALQTVDARLPVPIPTPMTDMWSTGLEQQRLAAAASALFGASGLLLAIIGTYGVLAYAVSARAREFGIRLALGAERRDVLLDVLRRGALLAAVGLTAGVGAGVLVNRALADVATETAGTPLHLVVAVVSVLGASAIVASLVPALRATRIDPADVMRIES
jgi:putative ABC transport system permease protein